MDSRKEDYSWAIKVTDNWRASHAYPMHVIYMNLRRNFSNLPGVIVAERLKRLSSIVEKIQRFPDMKLSRIQDLGGCRVITNTVNEAYEFCNKYCNSRIRHTILYSKDYVQKPKESGYRSLHRTVRFYSDKKETYNDLLIEIQFRSHLQHIWATAVETMDTFTGQSIKSGFGKEDDKRFFALMSSAIAIRENCPTVPNTPDNLFDIATELAGLEAKHNYIDQMRNYSVVCDFYDILSNDKRTGYLLLQLDASNKLTAKYFKASEVSEASDQYSLFENEYASSNTVLVRVNKISEIRNAYPNYFADITEFVNILCETLGVPYSG